VSIESAGAYLDLISKFVKTCATVLPAVAWLLRALGVIRKPPPPRPDESALMQLGQVVPIVGFGCLGSVLGLLVTIVFSVGAVIFLGLKFVEASTYGATSVQLPEIHLPQSDLLYGAGGLGMTLLAFGMRNQAKAIAFISGALCGMTFGLLFLLMMAMGN
jgi:hypothetical protein